MAFNDMGQYPQGQFPQNNMGQYPQGQFPQGMYASSPKRSNPSRRYWILAVLLVIMAVICFLLIQGDLAFPGIYFWFIGGDIMQFWFIVLVILGFVYLGNSGARKQSSAGGFSQRSDPYGYAGNFGGFPAQQTRRAAPSLLLRLPLVLLLVFLIYYFFIQGYTFRINPNPTLMGDCNAGSITVVGNATSNQVSLNAGITTIEGYGNYDQASNTLNINGNLCGLTISVPADSHLHISGNDAEISVTGIKGKIELDDNAGDITISGSRLLAGSVVTNNAGNITINHSCLLDNSDVENNGGAITITNSNVSPSAKVDINGGSPTITSPTDGCPV
ncbi:MAG TPA: hypothetical protein VKT82_16110 [Ktedonobacterales bacterium]|nr:hypothetical protein [Ktedonobacterales bacterium]